MYRHLIFIKSSRKQNFQIEFAVLQNFKLNSLNLQTWPRAAPLSCGWINTNPPRSRTSSASRATGAMPRSCCCGWGTGRATTVGARSWQGLVSTTRTTTGRSSRPPCFRGPPAWEKPRQRTWCAKNSASTWWNWTRPTRAPNAPSGRKWGSFCATPAWAPTRRVCRWEWEIFIQKNTTEYIN